MKPELLVVLYHDLYIMVEMEVGRNRCSVFLIS